jgi:hypothetical protein
MLMTVNAGNQLPHGCTVDDLQGRQQAETAEQAEYVG